MNTYDYIFAGGGASGLITAYRICQDKDFADKTILIIDKEEKMSNDRTWCYWESGTGEWDNILTKKWESIIFAAPGLYLEKDLKPFSYKMIRSKDLYLFLKNKLTKNRNIHIIQDRVTGITPNENEVYVSTSHQSFTAKNTVFNSIPEFNPIPSDPNYPYLKQHFVGWFIKSKIPAFDPKIATFMDFDIPQQGNTRFIYVLPFSQNRALVEYTLFSEHLLDFDEYEKGIKDYLKRKGISDFEIEDKEYGNIPMTCYPLHLNNTNQLIHIGSAGGWTKASTGFTFMNICRNSIRLLEILKRNQKPTASLISEKYMFYDRIFIEVLAVNNSLGYQIFSSLFENIPVEKILRFLNNDSVLREDLLIMAKTSPRPQFTLAFLRVIYKNIISKFIKK